MSLQYFLKIIFKYSFYIRRYQVLICWQHFVYAIFYQGYILSVYRPSIIDDQRKWSANEFGYPKMIGILSLDIREQNATCVCSLRTMLPVFAVQLICFFNIFVKKKKKDFVVIIIRNVSHCFSLLHNDVVSETVSISV